MRFWDSSALVPLLAPQPSTTQMQVLLEADPQMLVWWGTPVECVSALARLEREQRMSPDDTNAAQARLRGLAQVWHEVQPHTKVRTSAQRLLRIHPLRAADALQLAAAIEVARADAISNEFVCLDRRLSEAATREGLIVIGGNVEEA